MKVCVYGAGAIGAHIAVLMKLAGIDVSVVARGANLAAIQKNGLKLIIGGEEKVAHLPAAKEPADLGPQDYVIVALKSHQAWDAADHLRPLLGPDTPVVTAQNGIPWWYFHGFEGQYANLQLESEDFGSRRAPRGSATHLENILELCRPVHPMPPRGRASVRWRTYTRAHLGYDGCLLAVAY